MFALLYGAANGMMTTLRGTLVQLDVLIWTQGYGGISGLLSIPSNIAKGTWPDSAAAIWRVQRQYALAEWMVLAVSLVVTVSFAFAAYFAQGARMAKHETSPPAISPESSR